MKKSKGLLVFWSLNHIYCDALLVFGPIFIFVFGSLTKAEIVYVLFAMSLLTNGYALSLLIAFLHFDAEGIYCRRPFRKTIFLRWDRIVGCGVFQRVVSPHAPPMEFYFFSAGPEWSKAVVRSKRMPQLSEGLLFITARPCVKQAILQYAPSERIPRRLWGGSA